VRARWVTAFFALAGIGMAGEFAVCVEDRTGLPGSSMAAFRGEFAKLAPAAEMREDACLNARGTIQLLIRFHPPSSHPGALGLAHMAGMRILPRLEIYLSPVLRIVHGRLSADLVGRALARVAAHEIGHYVLQEPEHHASGLMRESFADWQLAGEDSGPFRLARDFPGR